MKSPNNSHEGDEPASPSAKSAASRVTGNPEISVATRGGLMTRATSYLATATDQIDTKVLSGVIEVCQTIIAFEELLHALADHARFLVDSELNDPVDPLNPVTYLRNRAAAQFTKALKDASGVRLMWDLGTMSISSTPGLLKGAAMAVRAGTDLLATHRDADGEWRTPESSRMMTLSARIDALDRVSDLVIMMDDFRWSFLPSAIATGLATDQNPLPDLSRVCAAARKLRTPVASAPRG